VGTVEFFDHTADLGMRIRGSDYDDLFRTAAEGLFDVIVANRDAVCPIHGETVSLQADTTIDLLIAWLNELIFRSETRHFLYTQFRVQVAPDGLSLQAEIRGEPIDRDRHVLDHEVKAVTHHALSLEHDDQGWMAELILDI
jgi:SHS2 domain-containing protein